MQDNIKGIVSFLEQAKQNFLKGNNELALVNVEWTFLELEEAETDLKVNFIY